MALVQVVESRDNTTRHGGRGNATGEYSGRLVVSAWDGEGTCNWHRKNWGIFVFVGEFGYIRCNRG